MGGLRDQRSMVRPPIKIRGRAGVHARISHSRISLIYGHPYMIDVVDCDARLPSSGDSNDLYLDELLRLSVLLGRVLKTIYTYVIPLGLIERMGQPDPHFSPAGLTIATDEQLHKLLEDLEAWKQNLPGNLRFNGPDTGPTAGAYWYRGTPDDWLKVALLVRSVVHALHVCKYDLLACFHADILHVSSPPQVLFDG